MDEPLCGQSDWFAISQEQVNQFADVTCDHQYLHVDQERAANTIFGGTIVHGFYYLSLIPHLMLDELFPKLGDVTVLNYGVNQLRFLTPVPVGGEVRLNWRVVSEENKGDGRLLVVEVVMDLKGGKKPALGAESVLYIVK